MLQGRDDRGRVDQGIPEAEIAQHGGKGGQEHPLVLWGPGGGGSGQSDEVLEFLLPQQLKGCRT